MLPQIFTANTVSTGAELDANFNAVGALTTVQGTASGTNTISVTIPAGYPSIAGYGLPNPVRFGFVAVANSTGSVTLRIVDPVNGAQAFIPAYLPNGSQAGNGSIVNGQYYEIVYVASLNSGSGGWQITSGNAVATTAVLRDYLAGLTISNDNSTPNTVLDIAAGICADSTNIVYISLGAFTKSTGGAWVAGSGANGMGSTLTIAINTWYHVFAIVNSGVADVYFDTSVTAAHAPAGTTAFRRIASFKTDGSAHILTFIQNGDDFYWLTPITELSTGSAATSLTALTLGGVPPGVIVLGWFFGSINAGTAIESNVLEVGSIGATNGIPIASAQNSASGVLVQGSGNGYALTTTTPQINYIAALARTAAIATIGYRDTRGRFA